MLVTIWKVINLNRKIIGVGRTATVYEYDQNKVIKLFNHNISIKSIEKEYLIYTFLKDLPLAPKVFSKEKVRDKYGIVFERVYGSSLLSLLITNPNNLKIYAKKMANIHTQLHSTDIVLDKTIIDKLSNVKVESISQKTIKLIIDYTKKLMGRFNYKTVCHGDFHPDNILVGDKIKILDFANAYYGHPLSDVAKTKLILESPFIPSELDSSIKEFLIKIKTDFKNEYINQYLKMNSFSNDDLSEWILPMALTRLTDKIEEERAWLIELIEKHI